MLLSLKTHFVRNAPNLRFKAFIFLGDELSSEIEKRILGLLRAKRNETKRIGEG